jgi:hypothetical protein
MGAARKTSFAALERAFEREQYYLNVFEKKIDNAEELQ